MREAMLEVLPRLRRFAWSLTGNRHDADDLLQSTVERMLTRAAPENVDVLKWMFKVCRNLWIDEIRARDVRLRAVDRPELQNEQSIAGEDVVIGQLTLREVDRAMAALPEEQREVICLVAVEGMSYREAADVLEIPIGTVMSRLARARIGLTKQIEQTGPTDPVNQARGQSHDG